MSNRENRLKRIRISNELGKEKVNIPSIFAWRAFPRRNIDIVEREREKERERERDEV